MTVKRFAIDIRLREITHGKSRTRLQSTILRTDSRAAADHIMWQACDADPNWNPGDEIAHAWDGFSEDDQAVLEKEGLGP